MPVPTLAPATTEDALYDLAAHAEIGAEFRLLCSRCRDAVALIDRDANGLA